MTSPSLHRRIAVIGSRSIGKSSMVIQYVDEHFTDTAYYPTIENTYTKSLMMQPRDWQQLSQSTTPSAHSVSGVSLGKKAPQRFTLEIVDTAGQDEYSIMPASHALNIHGYLLCYSIASRGSFQVLRVLRDKLLELRGDSHRVPCVLVGEKCDLDTQRQVSVEEGQALAQEWGCAFCECSSKNNTNIQQVFQLILLEIEKAMSESNAVESGSGGRRTTGNGGFLNRWFRWGSSSRE